jgi:6-pyruvoyltetrahydropterin/6-carboxytetrahydropterin synthase
LSERVLVSLENEMYEVQIEARFSAAHQVRMYDGELEPIHGHDWRVEAVYRGGQLDEIGVLIDFVAVQAALDALANQLHHTHLNEVSLLAGDNPTAEHVARRVFDQLHQMMPEAPLAGVYVHEAPGCVAGYFV